MAEAPEREEPTFFESLRLTFLRMGFMETEATRLAEANANATVIGWWLEQGCTFRQATEIAT